MQIIINNRKVDFVTQQDGPNPTVFKHFKHNEYTIVCLAKDCESLNELIVYQDISDNNKIWVREKNEFFSKVDKVKYPDCKQEYRFEVKDE